MIYKVIYKVQNSARCSRATKENLESQSRGDWEKRVMDDLPLIHHTFTVQKSSTEGFTMFHAPGPGHAGPRVVRKATQ